MARLLSGGPTHKATHHQINLTASGTRWRERLGARYSMGCSAMSLATLAVAAAVLLAAIGAAVSLWRGAARQPWPDLRAYRWFTIAAGLICANVIVGQAVPVPEGTAALLSFTPLPSLPLLPVMAAGPARAASAPPPRAPGAPPPPPP